MARGRGKPVGIFIRDFLAAREDAYVMEVWRAYKQHLRSLGYRVTSYRSIGVLFNLFKRANAIEFTRASPVPVFASKGGAKTLFREKQGAESAEAYDPKKIVNPSPRHYYRLVNPGSPVWEAPWEYYRTSLLGRPPVSPRPKEVVTPSPARPQVPGGDIADQIKGMVDEDKKAASIRRIEDFINRYDLTEENIEGIEAVKETIEAYRDIEREGLTPEEYADEKTSAYQDISDAIDELQPVEPEEEEEAEEGDLVAAVLGQFAVQEEDFLKRLRALVTRPSKTRTAGVEADLLKLSSRVGTLADQETDPVKVVILEGYQAKLEQAAELMSLLREALDQSNRRAYDRNLAEAIGLFVGGR
jgi:hypothetical protein